MTMSPTRTTDTMYTTAVGPAILYAVPAGSTQPPVIITKHVSIEGKK